MERKIITHLRNRATMVVTEFDDVPVDITKEEYDNFFMLSVMETL